MAAPATILIQKIRRCSLLKSPFTFVEPKD